MYDYNKFLRAIDRNFVIYDQDAEAGKMTTHLFACMNQAARLTEGITSRIYKWYLPATVIKDFMEEPTDGSDATDYNKYIMGLEWEKQPKDLFGGTKITNKKGKPLLQNAWLLPGDKYYVIGETDNGEYIIGSC